MNLKTFRASTMAEALAQVKKDLGKEAVILHTRTYKVGAIMGVGGKSVVEITASDQQAARDARRQAREHTRAHAQGTLLADAFTQSSPATAVIDSPPREASGRDFVPSTFAGIEPKVTTAPPFPGDPQGPSIDTRSSAVQAFLAAAPKPVAVASPRPLAIKAKLSPVDDSAMQVLHEELSSIKRLVGQVLQCSRSTAAQVTTSAASGVLTLGGMSDPLFACFMRLQEAGVSTEIAEEIAGSVRDELSPSELGDEAVVRQGVIRRLSAILPGVGSIAKAGVQQDSRPLTIALVGPTGVGKTTTIAKLAANYKLRHAKRVGLVTSDTYRIAAVDQLRTYANIIGLPIKVVMSPGELGQAVDSLSDCDVILIDTAGRSQHDATRLEELSTFIAAARPHETHLVLSSTVSEPVLRKTSERFAAMSPDHVIFTKLDEAVQLGAVVNVMKTLATPISYVTTGQEVPDQIELANAERLARAVLDGGLGGATAGGTGGRNSA